MFLFNRVLPLAVTLSLLKITSAQVAAYGQCGGSGYTGSTSCVSGAVCSSSNPYYYQCIPGTAAATSVSTTKTSTVVTSTTSTKATTATTSTHTSSTKITTTTASKTSTTASSGATSPASGTKYLMVFGDSYSTTGFWIGGDKPSASSPIGNPGLPGTTTSGGLNWVGQTVSKLNTSLVLAYDLAVYGAVTDSSIVSGYASYNFDGQVGLFQSYLAAKPDYAPWTAKNTLVAVWIGINDVGESFWSYEATPLNAVMDEYFSLLQTLYNDGATNFVLFTVPPFDRAPVMIGQTTDRLDALRSNITAYNAALSTRLSAFAAANAGVTSATLFDTAPSFDAVLADPTAYGVASSDTTCYNSDGVSCVWFDNYHPGQAVQRLVGQAFVKAMTGKFF